MIGIFYSEKISEYFSSISLQTSKRRNFATNQALIDRLNVFPIANYLKNTLVVLILLLLDQGRSLCPFCDFLCSCLFFMFFFTFLDFAFGIRKPDLGSAELSSEKNDWFWHYENDWLLADLLHGA